MSSSNSVSIVSESTILPDSKSPITSLRLSVSDLPMLTFQYIQKGCLFSGSLSSADDLISHLKLSLSKALSVFPPLAARLSTDPTTGHISISCSDAGALFVHARATSFLLADILDPCSDVPAVFRQFFPLNDTLSYDGHSTPLAAVQVTELADAVFIGCSVSHAVVDGTSFWNFFNTFAEISRGNYVSRPPSFSRDNVFRTDAALQFAGGRPAAKFSGDTPIRERIFHFTRQAILALKKRATDRELTAEISSFQSLCAQLWRSVTRARILPSNKTTTFSLAVNCRQRVHPKMDLLYFGNAIQVVPTVALAGDVASRELGWIADLLHRNVVAHDDVAVRKGVEAWERDPRCFELGNPDGSMIIIGSSPRFPMYYNDFGWGRPLAVRSGKANKVDGHLSAFPGREGDGGVDFEVVLMPDTMAGLEKDPEFMQYVS